MRAGAPCVGASRPGNRWSEGASTTYTIEVPVEVEQVLAARAQARGVSVAKYLQDIVIREAAPNGVAPRDVEMDALEELALELAFKYPRTEPLAHDAVALTYADGEEALR